MLRRDIGAHIPIAFQRRGGGDVDDPPKLGRQHTGQYSVRRYDRAGDIDPPHPLEQRQAGLLEGRRFDGTSGVHQEQRRTQRLNGRGDGLRRGIFIGHAIALHAAVMAHGSVGNALARFESGRRAAVEKIQHAADVSLVWFEHVRRFWPMHPTRFAFGVMTRSKAITYDDLALRAPAFVREVDALFAREANPANVNSARPPMFQPFRLRGMSLVIRVVASPMCQYSAEDGVPTDWHLVHYGARSCDRRRRPALYRDDLLGGRRADHPGLCRPLER